MTLLAFSPFLTSPYERGEVGALAPGEGDKINCHPSFSASLNVKESSLLLSPLSKGEPVGSNSAASLSP